MKSLFILAALLIGAMAQSSNQIRILSCCLNTIKFMPGHIDSKTRVPSVNTKANLTYTFQNLPAWLTQEGSVISGIPALNTNQTTKVKVSYQDNANALNKGETSFLVVEGNALVDSNPAAINTSSAITFVRDYVMTLTDAGYNFTAIYPQLPNKTYTSPISIVAESQIQAPKVAVLTKQNLNNSTVTTTVRNLTQTTTSNSPQVVNSGSITIRTINVTSAGTSQPQAVETTLVNNASVAHAQPTTSVLTLTIDSGCIKAQVDLRNSKDRLATLKWKYQILQSNLTAKEEQQRKVELAKNDPQAGIKKLEDQLSLAKTSYSELANAITHFNEIVNSTQKQIQSLNALRQEEINKHENETAKYRAAYEEYAKADRQLQAQGRLMVSLNENLTKSKNQLYMNNQALIYSKLRVERARIQYQAAINQNKGIQDGVTSLEGIVQLLQTSVANATTQYYKDSRNANTLREKSVVPPQLQPNQTYDNQIQELTRELQNTQVKLANTLSYESLLKQNVANAQQKLDDAKKSPNKNSDSNKSNIVATPEIAYMRVQLYELKNSIANIQKRMILQQKAADKCPVQTQLASSTLIPTFNSNTFAKQSQSILVQAKTTTKSLTSQKTTTVCTKREGTIKGTGTVASDKNGVFTVGDNQIVVDDCTNLTPQGTKKGNIKVADKISYEGVASGGKILASKLTVG